MLSLLLLVVMTASASERAEHGAAEAASRRLEERAQLALDALLGERMAVVTVELTGERVVSSERSEVVTEVRPVGSKTATAEMMDVPGYGKAKVSVQVTPDPPVVHRLVEDKQVEGGFVIKTMRAALVIDPTAGEESIRRAVEVCGQVLGMDPGRGDELEVVRAVLQPRWKRVLSRAIERRAAFFAAAVALALLFIGVVSGGFRSVAKALKLVPTPTRMRRVETLPRLGAPPAEVLPDEDGGGS